MSDIEILDKRILFLSDNGTLKHDPEKNVRLSYDLDQLANLHSDTLRDLASLP